MLVLARKVGEALAIGDSIIVRVLELKNGQVKIGVEAPEEVPVHREEILERIRAANRQAALEAPADLSGLGDVLTAKKVVKKEV